MLTAFFGTSSFVACNRAISSRSLDFPPNSSTGLPASRRFNVSRSTSRATTNLAFGGDDWKTLYFTSRNHLGAINVKISGVPVPPQKK
jgi:hypothetical protein